MVKTPLKMFMVMYIARLGFYIVGNLSAYLTQTNPIQSRAFKHESINWLIPEFSFKQNIS